MSLDIERSVVFKGLNEALSYHTVPNKSCKISVFLLPAHHYCQNNMLRCTLTWTVAIIRSAPCCLIQKTWLFHQSSLHHLFPGQLLWSQWKVFSLSGHSLVLAPASFVETWCSADSCEDYCKCSFVENKIALVETNIFTFWESQINNSSLNTINTFRLDFNIILRNNVPHILVTYMFYTVAFIL